MVTSYCFLFGIPYYSKHWIFSLDNNRYMKEGSSLTVMGMLSRKNGVLMIVPLPEPLTTGCALRKFLLPIDVDGLVLIYHRDDSVVTNQITWILVLIVASCDQKTSSWGEFCSMTAFSQCFQIYLLSSLSCLDSLYIYFISDWTWSSCTFNRKSKKWIWIIFYLYQLPSLLLGWVDATELALRK